MSRTPRATAPEPPRAGSAWENAPFDAGLAGEIRQLLARLDPGQRLWLSGYLAGTAERASIPAAAADPGAHAAPVTVLYGSQSGNSERLARQTAETLTERGIPVRLLDMMDCQKSQLQEARTLLVVVSTHGEGDPPDRALPLHELLHSRKAPALRELKFSVLALGDSTYEKFCETGRQFDARLESLGAERLYPRAECDVDFEVTARAWIDAVVDKVAAASSPESRPALQPAGRATASVSMAYTRRNPFEAPVLVNQKLTARSSTKDVRHIELSLDGSSIRYEPGDAIGVSPRNQAQDVDALLAVLRFDPEAATIAEPHPTTLRDALLDRYDIGLLTPAFLERYAAATGSRALAALLQRERAAELRQFLRGRHLIDLVQDHPPEGLDAGAFLSLLRPLAPRLYSIASSQKAAPDEVHLTVSVVEYESLGRPRRGVVSGFLADLTSDDAVAPIYLHRNPNFRLPAAPETPIIMIGPGTGVAPFRAFVAERSALGAPGRNWLFFGDRSFRADFLYQAEWLEWRKRGALHRIDVAFSRDQDEKVYVQHRMRERGAELWSWLQDGAHVYVCGDAERMAPDVHGALLDIVRRHGGLSDEQAAEYLLGLQRERRYQKDVY